MTSAGPPIAFLHMQLRSNQPGGIPVDIAVVLFLTNALVAGLIYIVVGIIWQE
jgi:hypothetical protein